MGMIRTKPRLAEGIAFNGDSESANLAAVVIGRNEAERLSEGLAALKAEIPRVVYVDSGSRDGSVDIARQLGVRVVELDASHPFTAARARNAGLDALATNPPDFVQFIDGDCVLRPGWATAAKTFLAHHSSVAVVFGRRRERRPKASVFNRFCDMEWDGPVGKSRACGGDAMMRYRAVTDVGRFRGELIAGEEPELCLRLRAENWKIWRLDADMTWHDANIMRPGPWLRRSRRAGYAFAEGAALHGCTQERHWVAETRRALFWGVLLPLMSLAAAMLHPVGAVLWLAYPAQVARIAWRHGIKKKLSWQYAFYLTLSKFSEATGVLQFWLNRLAGQSPTLVEYK